MALTINNRTDSEKKNIAKPQSTKALAHAYRYSLR
jgi:hypothetical protein